MLKCLSSVKYVDLKSIVGQPIVLQVDQEPDPSEQFQIQVKRAPPGDFLTLGDSRLLDSEPQRATLGVFGRFRTVPAPQHFS